MARRGRTAENGGFGVGALIIAECLQVGLEGSRWSIIRFGDKLLEIPAGEVLEESLHVMTDIETGEVEHPGAAVAVMIPKGTLSVAAKGI